MLEDFISIDRNTGEIGINREAIMSLVTYKAFNELLRRDRKSVGDSQGRKKAQFLRELGYIWILGSPKSYPNENGYDFHDADLYAKEMVGLPRAWKPDDLVKECLGVYKRELPRIDKRLARNLVKILRNYEKMVEVFSVNTARLMQGQELTIQAMKDLKSINDYGIELVKTIPPKILELNKFLKELDSEETEQVQLEGRGSLTIDDSMEPSKAIG